MSNLEYTRSETTDKGITTVTETTVNNGKITTVCLLFIFISNKRHNTPV